MTKPKPTPTGPASTGPRTTTPVEQPPVGPVTRGAPIANGLTPNGAAPQAPSPTVEPTGAAAPTPTHAVLAAPATPADPATPAEGPGPQAERLRRWRLVLGGGGADGTGVALRGQDVAVDAALTALYGQDAAGAGQAGPVSTEERTGSPGRAGTAGGSAAGRRGRRSGGESGSRAGGLGASAPSVARWLGDIRRYFPTSVVQVMQRDAVDRLGPAALLREPRMWEAVEPDVHLVGALLALGRALPETTRETARAVVRQVVRELERRFAARTRDAVSGALDRTARTRRPRHHDIDWNRTVRANLRHYLPEYRTVVPERLVGHQRAARAVTKEVVLCVDRSGSMASSVVHASVFAAVLASTRSLATRLVVFDTAVADLTDLLDDPVDVLFGTQLGGGTDINRALAYCQTRITRPADTVLVLISDLYEGGAPAETLARVGAMKAAGVNCVVLLALSDEGAPAFDRDRAAALAALGVPAFACTPDLFPEVMAAALEDRPLPLPDPGHP